MSSRRKERNLYDAVHHGLVPVVPGDLRPLAIGAGQATLVAGAPIHLIYIVDVNKLSHTTGYQEPGLQDPDIPKIILLCRYRSDCRHVYLFAASRGTGIVVP